MGDLVPVICFHSWLPVTADGIEECRHCKLAYHVEERFVGLKGAKKSGINRDKFRNGDPKKANTVRPPFCNGNGPEPIAYIARSVAIEWGILIPSDELPAAAPIESKPEETPMAVSVQLSHAEAAKMGIEVPVDESSKHPNATGLGPRQKHTFIEKYKGAILIDIEGLGLDKASELWGLGLSTLRKLHYLPIKQKAGRKKKTEAVQKPQQPVASKAAAPVFTRSFDLTNGAGVLSLSVTGNVLAFCPKDRDFVMQLVKMIEDHETNTDKV